MIEALLLFLVVCLIAGAAYWLLGWIGLPHPLPAIVAAIIVLLGLIMLIGSVDGFSFDAD